MNSKLSKLFEKALELIPNPKNGLPQEAFYFVSQLTPLINVDLLIKNNTGQTLLTWREDKFYGPAWHIPGGIIRFKESIEDRILMVSKCELGCNVEFNPDPINVRSQINNERNIRGHFISLLFLCRITSELDNSKRFIAKNKYPSQGQWAWHNCAPKNLLSIHESFRKFIDAQHKL